MFQSPLIDVAFITVDRHAGFEACHFGCQRGTKSSFVDSL
jgi:hypothetical protein